MTYPSPYQLRRDTPQQGDRRRVRRHRPPLRPVRTGLRLAFVLSCVLPGPQFVAYILLWVLIPGD